MAGWIRQRESGGWAATVRTRQGRVTETFPLKQMAEDWATDTRAADLRGEWINPKLGQVTVGEMWARYADSRRLANASRKRDESHWRVHVAPRWGSVAVGDILKPDIDGWVRQLEKNDVNAPTIEAAVGVLRAVLQIAVDAGKIRVSPAVKVKTPQRQAHLDRILDDHEDAMLLGNLDRRWPGMPYARLFVEVLLYCGLRYEEAAALDRDHVDMRQRILHIGPVMEKDGSIRPYPKSRAGVRAVPVDDDVWPRLREHALRAQPGGLLFTAAGGGHLLYDNWNTRVWKPGLRERVAMTEAEIAAYVEQRRAVGKRSGWRPEYYREVPLLADPQPTPHDMRHTYGTRLAEDGLPPHEIMALMGHASLKAVQRYLHAREGRFDRARQAMAARRRSSNVYSLESNRSHEESVISGQLRSAQTERAGRDLHR